MGGFAFPQVEAPGAQIASDTFLQTTTMFISYKLCKMCCPLENFKTQLQLMHKTFFFAVLFLLKPEKRMSGSWGMGRARCARGCCAGAMPFRALWKEVHQAGPQTSSKVPESRD